MTYAEIEKAFENTDFSKEQKAFIIAKTWYEFLQQQDEEITAKIVAENVFYYPFDNQRFFIKKGDRITNPNDICYLVNNDKQQWDNYYNLYFAECQKRGIARAYNECIDSVAREIYIRAGNVLIDCFFEKVFQYISKKDLAENKLEYLNAENKESIKKSLFTKNKVLDLAMKCKF